MKLSHLIVVLTLTLFSSACSNWIYRIDIPQGNFLDEQDVEKLRIGMTKEQVEFVLGRPILKDAFDHDTWYYYYEMKRGMSKRGEDFEKSLTVYFVNDKVDNVETDFELSEDFNTPLEQ
ncbi:outer membrane protein assembly factor BamE [Alteromonas gilva]|uniref:Outer membrane protein assembly factor BamE n=1 Tax=Alteromonas gilva TaxID=2987522 RepID=A0ABT5L7K2_9ALTE|nr:outer membrane protein assembly factor BamE [Alteromonas gilva]MDC8831728.1 outer membrane protein assembly factor BamE [Alteromonas gilva]